MAIYEGGNFSNIDSCTGNSHSTAVSTTVAAEIFRREMENFVYIFRTLTFYTNFLSTESFSSKAFTESARRNFFYFDEDKVSTTDRLTTPSRTNLIASHSRFLLFTKSE